MRYILSLALGLFSILLLAQAMFMTPAFASCVAGTDSTCVSLTTLPKTAADRSTLAVISNIVFSIIGLVALIMIILGGFKYISSSGKPEELARAKDTIIYAAVGIVVCVFAVTIVSFVAGFFK